MFITCQTDMDFGMDHNTAMDTHLRKFFLLHWVLQEFKNSYKPMQWIALSGHVVSKERQKTSLLPKDIDEEERDWIRTIQLDESESEQEGSDEAEVNMTTEFSDQERESKELDTDSTYLGQ